MFELHFESYLGDRCTPGSGPLFPFATLPSSCARVTAPLNGVITARHADTSALIAAGTISSAQSVPVVKIAKVSNLRLVLPVLESLALQIHWGDSVKVHISALGTDIVGKVSRFAGALDLQTRTIEA